MSDRSDIAPDFKQLIANMTKDMVRVHLRYALVNRGYIVESLDMADNLAAHITVRDPGNKEGKSRTFTIQIKELKVK